jgi:hypothetical protein
MNKKHVIMIVCLATIWLGACAPSPQAIQTAIAQTQEIWTVVPTQRFYPTYTLQPTIFITIIVTPMFTPTPLDNTRLPINKADCTLVNWLTLASNLDLYVGKCIYIEGREIGLAKPTDQVNRPPDEGRMVIQAPEPNNKSPYLEVTLYGDQDFYNTLESMLSANQGWIGIWGTFRDERNLIDPNNPSPFVGYPLYGYMLYSTNVEALTQCPIGKTRTEEGICAIGTPTPNPLQRDKSDGFYLVGVEIAPGVWRSQGNSDNCYWSINTRTGDIIKNYFGMAGGTMYIPSTAFQVTLQDCGNWVYLGP